MEKFQTFTSHACPFPDINVDTDIIIPKQFLKTVKRTGLGVHAFHDRRYLDGGEDNPDFPMNKPEYAGAGILIAGDNFGCGSSREHAVWAIMDMGIRAIISSSFADIFKTNATKNGLLLIQLREEIARKMMHLAESSPDTQFTIDLKNQHVEIDGHTHSFDIDDFVKHCFLNGLDEIALTLKNDDKITAYETDLKQKKPWLFSE